MLQFILLAALLAATPPKVVAPGLKSVNVSPELQEFFSEHLAQELRSRGFEVVTHDQVAALVGLERQKQLLGCSELGGACMAEMGNALGAQLVLTGRMGKFEGVFQLDVSLVSTTTGTTTASYSGKCDGGERAILEELSEVADALAVGVGLKSRPVASHTASWLRPTVLVPGAIAVAAAATGGVFLARANADYQTLRQPAVLLSVNQINATAASGRTNQLVSQVALGGAVVALGVAAGMMLFGAPQPAPSVAVTISPLAANIAGAF